MTTKATHQDSTEFDGPVDTGNPHAKRPADKKQGDMNANTAVSSKDPGTVFNSGKVAEEVQKLFAGLEGISEDFTTRATVMIESAMGERISTIREELQAEFDSKVEAAVNEQTASLEEKIDSYLSYVVEQFMTENQVAIDQGIKNEIAEQVLESVASIVEANGFKIPEDKVDVVEALTAENVSLEDQLNESLRANMELADENKKYKLAEAFNEVAADLSDAARDKLQKLSENISYSDVDDYKKRVGMLKESVSEKSDAPKTLVEAITTPVNTSDKTLSARQKAILEASRDH